MPGGPVAVATLPQGFALVLAASAAAAALALTDPRRRAVALLAALVLAAAALVALEWHKVSDEVSRHPALALAGAVVGLVALAVLAEILRRRPAALPLLVFAALPFRVPVPVGGDTANLLLPLYVVIGAGVLAEATRWLRPGPLPDQPMRSERDGARALRRAEIALAVVLVLYAAQSLYSTDISQATVNVCFFYVPFAVLFRLLLAVGWTRRQLIGVLGLLAALALIFAAVGFYEYATGRLLISNAKVLSANEIKSYFRVNSLFFDPNIYGRFLALTMIALAAALPVVRRGRDVAAMAVVLAILWTGLLLSLSQSSFAALLVGLAVLTGLRWRPRLVLAGCAAGVAATVVVIALAPELVGVRLGGKGVDASTSGRGHLIRGGVRMIGDRPVWGFGSGTFAERFRARERVRSGKSASASHTTPVTIGAEQGVIGLVAYLWLLWTAFALLFGGLRDALRRAPRGVHALARAAAGAAYAGLVLHTLVYAAFLEDPLAWALVAVGASLRLGAACEGEARGMPDGVDRARPPASSGAAVAAAD